MNEKAIAIMYNNGGKVKYEYRSANSGDYIAVYECMTTWQNRVFRGKIQLAGITVQQALEKAQGMIAHKDGFCPYTAWSIA